MDEVKTVIDNTKDWYDLADTALKIGLGAFIGGFFTYITTKSNHKHEISKEKFNRKIEMLNEATGKLENYFTCTFKLMDKWYGYASKGIKRKNQLKEKALDEYIEIDALYLQNTKDVQYAFAQLNMLGLKETRDIVIEYDKIILKIRNNIALEKDDIPSEDYILEMMGKTNAIKNKYYNKIKKYFDDLK